MKRYLVFFLLLAFTIPELPVLTGCANIIPPSGGPRDSLPPVRLKASPPDSALNFSENKILFVFDEFIEVQNARQALLISPQPRNFPSIDYRLNTMTVKFNDSLEPGTTYTLQFGDAVRDFTEGNILRNLSYTFSTGSFIDSLQIKGKVLMAETGKPDSTLVVMLHVSGSDSAVVRERPRYITRPDGNGQFVFRNLPSRPFYLYALKDDGGLQRYFDDKQLFAFLDAPVHTGQNSDSLVLYAWSAKTAGLSAQMLSGLNISSRSRNRNNTGATDKRLKFTTNLSENKQDLLKSFIMTFEEPLAEFDSTRVGLYTDSAFNAVQEYRLQQDSSRTILTLYHSWKENSLYHLVLQKEFAADSAGRKLLKTDTLSFNTKKTADYGALKIRLKNLKPETHPVLQILSAGSLVKSYPVGNYPEVHEALFVPGEYELRILFDNNQNGRWDPGQFFGTRKQPEKTLPLNRKIPVKPAFQNEFEINL